MALTAIDLFAGAGGLSLAALNSGFELRAAVESDKHSANTYRHSILPRSSFPIELFEADIRTLSWQIFLDKARLKSGECDLLLGGPPCQGFSTHRIKDAGIGDPRNELLLQYFKAIETIQPKTFLVENVSGLLWPRHAIYLRRFLDSAKAAGYSVYEPVLLNARDYGVPQSRKRLFILGVRSDVVLSRFVWPPKQIHFNPSSKEVLEERKPAWITAKVVFDRKLQEDDPNNIHMRPSTDMKKVFASTPKNGGSRSESKRTLPCHKKHDGHKDVYGRIDPRKSGPTMTTGCINPSKGRFVHPTANHAITARHAARFQAFPDDFVFLGGLTASGQQIGNAVPILLGEVLIGAIATALKTSAIQQRSAVV
jgi:DNA (cytosine-5)-methyltransferase 1